MTTDSGWLAVLVPILAFALPLVGFGAIAEAVRDWRREHPRRPRPPQRPPSMRGF